VPRVACLLLSDVPLTAAIRAEPELRGAKLCITRDLDIVSGWLRGLTIEQARTIEPDLIVRPLSIEGVHSAQEALMDVALSVTPRVEDGGALLQTGQSGVLLDLTGTSVQFPSERGLLTALDTRLHTVGLAGVRSGIGPTRVIAELAARVRDGGHIIDGADVELFIRGLPLDLLNPSDEILERLSRWGIRTLDELADIPRSALGARLGEAGVRLARRARGQDLEPFRPTRTRLRFEESIETGYPMDNLDALAFLLNGVSDRLGRRLRMRGLAVRELRVELVLEDGRAFARTIEMAAPTVEARVLTALVRLALEKHPPDAPVEHLRLIATPGSLETAQLDLFIPPLPAPAELAITMARLEALCGSGRVGSPGVEDTHRPDAARLDSFESNRRVTEQEIPRVLAPAMALRALRPPHAVSVRERDGLPLLIEDVRTRHPGLRILKHAGPWRLFGEWWGESCFARDYFDVELSDGGVYRMYHNLQNDTWYLDGIYD
jgi:protein ImuB